MVEAIDVQPLARESGFTGFFTCFVCFARVHVRGEWDAATVEYLDSFVAHSAC